MDSSTPNVPLYAKYSLIIIGVVAFFFILFIGQDILVPLIFSTLIAILLNPFVNFLCRKKINRVFAIFIAVFLAILILGIMAYFILSQATMLSDALPQFKHKFLVFTNECIRWLSANLGVSKTKMDLWLAKTQAEGMNNSTVVIGAALSTVANVVILAFLIPVYVFMILFYKPLLIEFIAQLFRSSQHELVNEVLTESKGLIQNYLVGLLLEAALVAALNSVGLLILGIEYAILIGIIGALLNSIPYIGGIIAISIPMLMAVATKKPIDALWVFIAYIIVQFIDNNFIVPKIVASKVKINALVSIVVVLMGGALWGIAGMFLAIPLTAIIKVIFDRIAPLKPFGFLLGDNQPQIGKFSLKIKRKK